MKYLDEIGLCYLISIIQEELNKKLDTDTISDYYNKQQIDNKLGDIETLLSNI